MITVREWMNAPVGASFVDAVGDEWHRFPDGWYFRIIGDPEYNSEWTSWGDCGFPAPLDNSVMHYPQSDIVSEAVSVVSGDRQGDYGDAAQSFSRIAELWSAYLDEKVNAPISSKDVAAMMILLKLSRSKTSDKRDTWIDVIGYAQIAGDQL